MLLSSIESDYSSIISVKNVEVENLLCLLSEERAKSMSEIQVQKVHLNAATKARK